jgi:hypothetical protein
MSQIGQEKTDASAARTTAVKEGSDVDRPRLEVPLQVPLSQHPCYCCDCTRHILRIGLPVAY